MNPSSPPPANNGVFGNLLNFLFGRGALGQAAGTGTTPQDPAYNGPAMQQTQQPNQMQGIVNAYMQQKQAADQLKKKKKQPLLEE